MGSLVGPRYEPGPAPSYGATVGVVSTQLLGQSTQQVEPAYAAAITCPAAGACVAGGSAQTPPNPSQAFVQIEDAGHWSSAHAVTADISGATGAVTDAVACASVGYCAAGGSYSLDNGADIESWVDSETDGVWSTATPIAASLNTDNESAILGVSCGAPGNCWAIGYYVALPGVQGTFVVNEVNGDWGSVLTMNVPGARYSTLSSLSCTSSTACVALGNANIDGTSHAYVAEEAGGIWSIDAEPFLEGEEGYGSFAGGVTCITPGNCLAYGSVYTAAFAADVVEPTAGVVARESNFSWLSPQRPTGPLVSGLSYNFTGASCPAVNHCTLTGLVELPTDDPQNYSHSFVISQAGSSWTAPFELDNGSATSWYAPLIGCPSVTQCVVIGTSYRHTPVLHPEVYAQFEQSGVWSSATEPLLKVDHGTFSEAFTMSCAAPSTCVSVDEYVPDSGLASLSVAQTVAAQSVEEVSGFGAQSSSLTRAMSASVMTMARAIAASPSTTTVDVAGYCAATERSPATLSKARANAVATALRRDLASLHSHATTISVVGYGATTYVAPNATSAGRAENRRVTVLL